MKSKLVGAVLATWIVLEILCFALVVRAVGLLAAIALALGASLLGLSDVRRLLDFVRAGIAAKARGESSATLDGAMLDGALQALASILLILPGFASDFVGLALKSPSVRQSLARRLRARSGNADPRLIDLDPREWRRDARRPRRTAPK
ncbi:FxsA family protein [Methylocystis rosea]|uniref:FxsA family protein n=1 Tax=Methylocystis rosea TaxID=173366 RepID=A0ABX6EHI1_9HYPH|nr:FxsA family protein [Methylocystis rosea]QGM94212.1 FxsA family protein [Methylocystis rosea]